MRWFGSDALELAYRCADGELGSEILYRGDVARMEMVEQGRPLSETLRICSTPRWRSTPR